MNAVGDPTRRLERAFREPAAGAASVGTCPSPEVIRAAVTLEGSVARRRSTLAHVAICPACTVAWDTLREFHDSAPAARPSGLGVWGSLAAAAALAFAFWLVPQTGIEQGADAEWRAGSSRFDWSGSVGETRLTADSTTLRWAPGPVGTRFELRVTDATLRPFARAVALELPEYSLSAESLTGLEAGSVLFWQVDAILPDGSRVVSPTFTATWAPARE